MSSAPAAPRPRRILVVKLGAIGDVLMAIPAVDRLRREMPLAPPSQQFSSPLSGAGDGPAAEVDWVIGASLAPLLGCFSWIHPVVADEHALLRGGWAERLRALRLLRRALRGRRYDLIATLYYDTRYRLLTRGLAATQRIALSRDDRARKILPGRHHSDEFVRILLGLPDECRSHSLGPLVPEHLPPSPFSRQTPGRRRIALVPAGASNMLRQQTLRRWPIANYVALAERLLARGDEVVLIGGPEDSWGSPAFAHLPPDRLRDTIGRLSLPEVIAAFNQCDLVVSHDTGPLHLAGLSSAPVIALFGPTDPGNFLPRRPGVWGVWGGEGFACRPCYDGATFAPCPNNGCMQQITPDAVLALVDRAIAARDRGATTGQWPRLLVPSQISGDSAIL